MGDAELRVVMAIARQTFGWHKKRDKISLTQLERLTGMSRQGVVNGLEFGIKRGLIERTPDPDDRRGGIWYRLLVNDVDQSTALTSLNNGLVREDDQSTSLTSSSQRGRPELVNDVDTQKKESKEKKETPTPPAPAAKHNGVGGGEIATLLDEYNIGASDSIAQQYQQQCPDVDAATIRQSIENLLADGVPKGKIVNRLRNRPPDPGKPYQRSRTAPKAGIPATTRPIIPADVLTPAQIADRARARRAERDT